MKDKLENLKKEILGYLGEVKDSDVLRELEIKYLSRKGKLSEVLKNLKNLDASERKEIGQLANEVKKEIQNKFQEVKNIVSGAGDKDKTIDVTLPGKKIKQGHLSPLTLVQNELEDLFTSMGFMVLD